MKNLLVISLLFFTIAGTAQRRYKNITERDGKIGIGTKTPDELLTVKGKIHTREVIVDLKGAVAPDYVFEHYFEGESVLQPEYSLPTLTEVEAFIKEYHHLPSVPSAAKLQEEGMALKEMNLILLQKVEELTLYTLEQQKEIEKLKARLEAIEN